MLSMISIKTKDEIAKMRAAGILNYKCHELLANNLKSGITTKELDDIAAKFIADNNAKSSFLGYQGFPGSICISINDEVVHGIPGTRKIKNGDIVSIDIGVIKDGYHSDAANTYAVGNIKKTDEELLTYTKDALYKGLEVIKEGIKLSDVSKAIESVAKKHHLGVVKELVGHGVGEYLHEDPEIPNYYYPGYKDVILKSGMTLAIEPMFTRKNPDVCILEDDWTIVTEDGSNAAHYEHTVEVTKNGYNILTKGD